MGYSSVVVLLCLVGYFAFASAQDGSYTSNFTFVDIVQYGNNRLNNTSVLKNPFDFTLSTRGNPVVSDLFDNSVFIFNSSGDTGFTKVNQTQGRIVDLTSTADAYLALIINNATGSRTDLFLTRNFRSFAQINDQSLGLQGLGVVYHTPSDTVYISDFVNRTISSYYLRDFSFRQLLGDTSTLGAAFQNPSAASLNGPFRMATDPAGLWVADQNNNRVLHFNFNSTIANIVLGQTNFSTNASGDPYNPAVLNRPYAIAYDQANAALYVSDSSGRILKFTSPFSNGQSAAAVLDATDALAQNLYTLKAANMPNGATRLFYLDNRRQKVTSGVVVIAPSPSATPSLSVSSSISQSISQSGSAPPVPLSSGASQSMSGSLSMSTGALPANVSQSRSGSLSQSQGDTPIASPTTSGSAAPVPLSSGASQSMSGSLSMSTGASPLASSSGAASTVASSAAPVPLSSGASQSMSGSLSQSQGASPLASSSGAASTVASSAAPVPLSSGASQSMSGSLSQSQGASPLASSSGAASSVAASVSGSPASQSMSGSLSNSQGLVASVSSAASSVAASVSGSPASQSMSGSLSNSQGLVASVSSAASLSGSPASQSMSGSLSMSSAPSLSASPMTQSNSGSLSMSSAPSLSASPMTQSMSGSLSMSRAASTSPSPITQSMSGSLSVSSVPRARRVM